MKAPIVYVNVGWMECYRGPKGDLTLGGHKYLREHQFGLEAWNYLPRNGRLYGYIPGSTSINISKLGAHPKDPQIDGVTVVWVAKDPSEGKLVVVGWYLNATVHRDQSLPVRRPGLGLVNYQIEAPADQALLLEDRLQRTVRVPTAKTGGNMGQRPIWYGKPSFSGRVRKLMADPYGEKKMAEGKRKGTPKQPDPLKRKAVEDAAVAHATAYFTSAAGGRFAVRDVSHLNEGWDLRVQGGDVELLVEVKGVSAKEVCVELTPNEYRQMKSKTYRNRYVLYVLTNADNKAAARSHVFYFHQGATKAKGQLTWLTREGRELLVTERVGARLTA